MVDGLIRAYFELTRTSLHNTMSPPLRYRPQSGSTEKTNEARSGRSLALKITKRIELLVYHGLIVPLVALLPAPISYKIACVHGDLSWKLDGETRRDIVKCVDLIFRDEISSSEKLRISREYLWERSCEAIDISLLARGKGESFGKLVEIRGLENLKEALVKGRGAVLYSAHYGSHICAFALLGSIGFPVTIMGRLPTKSELRNSSSDLFFARISTGWHRVARHLHRPNIEPRRGRFEAALLASKILRQNEVVVTFVDAEALDPDRALPVDFLGMRALLMPGSIEIAKVTQTPVLMAFIRRSEDWYHQRLEISPPVDLSGETPDVFRRCVAAAERAIRLQPAQWKRWRSDAFEEMGMLENRKPSPQPREDVIPA
jgi:lauroyl/myristoyl acyltransferase